MTTESVINNNLSRRIKDMPGIKGIKVTLPYGLYDENSIEKNIKELQECRDIIGKDKLLMIDCYMSLDLEYSIRLVNEINKTSIKLEWIEEAMPLICLCDFENYKELKKHSGNIKIAGGEHIRDNSLFQKLINEEYLDIVQPDIRWMGGLTEMLKLSNNKVKVIPHIGSPYSYHYIISDLHSPMTEFLTNKDEITPIFGDIFTNEVLPSEDGYLYLSQEPGFGLQINNS